MCYIYYLFMYDFITLIYLIYIFLLFCRYAVPDFPFAVDSKIQCENLNKIINELLKGLFNLLFNYFTSITLICAMSNVFVLNKV